MRTKLITLLATGVSAVTAYAQDKADSDATKLLGTWKVISAEDNGRKVTESEIPEMRWVISKERISVQRGEFINTSVYKIDPSKSPKWIDVEQGDQISKAIYELKGDQLRVCASEDHKLGRPTAFESKPDSVNDVLITLQRVSGDGADLPVAPVDLADPADVPKGFESFKLSKDQAAKINEWLKKQGDKVNPADFAKFVKAQLRKDQQEAFRKLLETGGG